MQTPRPRCFLCSPSKDLLVAGGRSTRLIAGLGPVVDGYCIVASHDHVPSLADLWLVGPQALKEVAEHRLRLEQRLGPILLTEHGRVPVCRDGEDEHEAHCFHAHALLFPTAVRIEERAASYYRCAHEFDGIGEAMRYAASATNYLLVSPSPSRFLVMTDSLGAPRQLARTLVAFAADVGGRADWRTHPERERAKLNACHLRSVLGNTPWNP